ncbi:MAG: SH3 domain-containing protein [Candidatus Aminicenantales bacterium]
MKKPYRGAVLLGVFLVLVTAVLAETLVVKIQTTQVRRSPQFFSQSLVSIKAGDSLEKLGEKDGWINVRTSTGVVGWVHSSAVEVRKFSLLAVDSSLKTKATAGEVALAGKGFNKQVEESYKAKHGKENFVWVDKMLQVKVSLAQVAEFLRKGKLGEFRGSK